MFSGLMQFVFVIIHKFSSVLSINFLVVIGVFIFTVSLRDTLQYHLCCDHSNKLDCYRSFCCC